MWTFPPNYVCMKSQSHKAALCYVKVLTRIMKLWSMSFIWSLTWTVVFLPTILTLTFLNMFWCNSATHSIQNCVQNNNTHCNFWFMWRGAMAECSRRVVTICSTIPKLHHHVQVCSSESSVFSDGNTKLVLWNDPSVKLYNHREGLLLVEMWERLLAFHV